MPAETAMMPPSRALMGLVAADHNVAVPHRRGHCFTRFIHSIRFIGP